MILENGESLIISKGIKCYKERGIYMAITWNFHLISSKCISLNTISDIVRKYQSTIGVKEVFSIDDWAWNNRQELKSILDINEKLDAGFYCRRTIVIEDMEYSKGCCHIFCGGDGQEQCTKNILGILYKA